MLKAPTPEKADHRLAPYTLFCSREPLSGTLGPPDYFPQSSVSAEESLSRETCQHGYKEVVEGVDEQREATFTLAQQSTWTKQNLGRYKEAIHKRLRAVNVCLVRKLKIGQVYGVALSGPMLHKPGVFPEQRLYADDFRRKWLDDLAQNTSLRLLSDHVPTGVHLHDLLELAAGRNFPVVRATWCVRVIFLNLIRHTSGPAGSDKGQGKRTESWTKEILEVADSLVSAICVGGDSNVTRGGQGTRSAQKKQLGYDSFRKLNDAVGQHGLTAVCQFVMCLTQWHCAQGLLNKATLIEFTLKQLSERESIKALELLLPMALFLLDGLSAPQAQVHTFVRLCAHWLQRISSAGSPLQLPDQPRLLYLKKSLVEVARYFLKALPPVSTALDCFPLLKTNSSVSQTKGYFYAGILSIDPGKLHESERARPASLAQAACSHLDNVAYLEKSLVPHKLLFPDICEAIAKGSSSLSKTVKPGFLEKNECKVLHGLDQALLGGDVLGAVCVVFGESRSSLPDDWLLGLYTSCPSIYCAIDPLQLSGVMSVCEWAVSGFREHRDVSGSFDGAFAVTDMSRIYLAISVLSLTVGEGRGMDVETFASNLGVGPLKRDKGSKGMLSTVKLLAGDAVQSNVLAGKHASRKTSRVMHNLIVAWLDQLDACKGKGSERLQLLLAELGRASLFCPGSYVRMLVTNGILEKSDTEADYTRAQRHRRLVSLLPKYEDLDSRRVDGGDKRDAIRGKLGVPSWNERRVALFGLSCRRKRVRDQGVRNSVHRLCHLCQQESTENMYDARLNDKTFRKKSLEGGMGSTGHFSCISLPELKLRICAFLRLPDSSVALKPRRASRKDCLKPSIPSTPAGFAIMADDGNIAGSCEGCSRSKRAKGVDGREADHHVLQSALKEEDWWSKQPQKVNTVEAFVKQPTKQSARGRPKVVRKTQGLAQLAATPEDTQSSLSAHRTLKGSCPPVSSEDNQEHSLDVHGLGPSGNLSLDLQKGNTGNDLCVLGAAVKDLHLSDRWELAQWLTQAIRRNLGKKPSTSSDGNCIAGRSLIASTGLVDVGSENGWQMDDEQFKAIVYLLHMTNDLRVLLELLLWLLSVVSLQRASARGMNNRNGAKVPTNKGELVRQVGEATIMYYIRRFDTAVAAMDLLPLVLTTGMQSAAKMLAKAPAAKASCRGVLSHVWAIMKKYGNLASVQSWETGWRASGGDKQLQAELEALKAADPDGGFGIHGRGACDTDDKHDDPVYMRLTGRLARTGAHMKETVQRHLGDMTHRLIARAKDFSGPGQLRDGDRDALDGILQTAQRAVSGLVEAIRQSGGSPVDPSLLAAAVAAVVVNVPTAVVSVFSAFVGTPNLPGAPSGLGPCVYCARYVLQMHIHCISFLKEVFGDHQSRLLEVALASEAVSVISSTLNRSPRMQILSSSDTCDIPSSLGNDSAMASCMAVLGRPTVTTVASVAAFVTGVVVQGNVSLERVVSLLRIKEGLETLQLSFRGSVNIHGTGRTSVGGNALNKAAEANLYWFRVLIGNCRSVSAGLINALLGESNSLGLAHLQRSLPLSAVLPSAYSLFSIALQKQGRYFHAHNRDESILQAALLAANDVVAHQPFRAVCFSDTEALYNLLSVDTEESQHAASLDNQGLDVSSKLMSLVPLRARVFLYAILEKKVPDCWVSTGEKTCNPGAVDHKCLRQMDVYKNTEELVKVLDNLHPATFHWQWVELRLLLNEQVILEKLESANVTAVQALEAAFAPQESRQLTECEKTFTEIVLTRLLVRPDAAAMYSEVLHFLGQAFEEYLVLQVKWVLEGSDMLFGRKSLRQVLDNYAHRQGFTSGHQGMNVSRCLPFGRKGSSCENLSAIAKSADSSGFKRRDFKMESQSLNRQYVIEKALVEMVLPCLVRSSVDACCGFGIELAKQLTNLEQHLSMLSRMNGRHVATFSASDNFNHKGLVQQRGSMAWLDNGSPGVGRKSLPPSSESQPLYAAAIQASVWLRLQFLMPLLPIIYSDREQMARNIQVILTPVVLRLLDSRVLQEPPDQTFITQRDGSVSGTDGEWIAEAATCGVAATAGEWVFDRLLAVLHFISNGMPSALLDQEVAERMQVELDQVTSAVTPHLLTVMSTAPPFSCRINAGPPELSQTTLASLQSGYLAGQATQMGTQTRDAPGGDSDAASVKGALLEQEVDPWSLLEDAAVGASVTGPSLGSSSDAMLTLKSAPWLRGAIRERRRDSIYAGSVDSDP